MASRTLNVTITGDARSLNRALGQVQDQTGRVGGSMTKFSTIAKGALAGAAVGGAAILTKGLFDSIHAAAEAQVSQSKLQAQLKASGLSYRANAAEIDRVIQKTSQLSGLDDEDLQDAFTNIVRVTGDVSKSLRLTGLAADFARAKHLDVAKAGEIVGKVAGGNIGILSRYGITIEKGATATEALGKLQQKFAGQAAAYGRTAAGAQDRFRVAVENLEEKIGKALLPTLTKAFNRVGTFINQMVNGTGAGGRFAKGIDDMAESLRPMIVLVGRVGGVIVSNMDRIGSAVKIATAPSRVMLNVFQSIAGAEVKLAQGAVSVGKALGGGLVSAARAVAGAMQQIATWAAAAAGAIQSLIDKIPHIKIPHIPGISSVGGSAIRPNENPGPSLTQQISFATSDVELAQSEVVPSNRVKALQHRQKLIASRLNQIRKRRKAIEKALMKLGRGKKRNAFLEEWLALTQEEATLASEINSLASDIVEAASPPAAADTPFDSGISDGGAGVTTVTDTTTAPDSSAADLAQAIKELKDAIDKQNRFAESAMAVQSGAVFKALGDLMSGQIFGQYNMRAATASSGGVVRY